MQRRTWCGTLPPGSCVVNYTWVSCLHLPSQITAHSSVVRCARHLCGGGNNAPCDGAFAAPRPLARSRTQMKRLVCTARSTSTLGVGCRPADLCCLTRSTPLASKPLNMFLKGSRLGSSMRPNPAAQSNKITVKKQVFTPANNFRV
jgi:hypothetical protein